MPEQTEAACLLVGGSSYRKRTLLHPEGGGDVFVGVRPGGFSIYRGDEPITHFDFEGRWQRAYLEGVHYLKSLDTSIRSIERIRQGDSLVLRRRTLPDAESAAIDSRLREDVAGLLATIDGRRFSISERTHGGTPLAPEEVRGLLGRSLAWDASAWMDERDRYHATYGPLPFLPPTCPSPLILQAAVSPGFGRAGGRGSRRRTVEEFEAHAEAVERLVGRRLACCRDIFLDGLDPVGRPAEETSRIVEATVRRYPLGPPARPAAVDEEARPLGSIQAMIDDFSGTRPRPDLWLRLKGWGLTCLTLGIESGDPTIRATYGKMWDNDLLAPIVEDLRDAQIVSDLVVLVGVGGAEDAAPHVEATLALVRSLPPSTIRRLYLVDARTFEGAPADASPLSDRESAEQTATLKAGLSSGSGQGRPIVIVYNADKQPI